VFNSVVANKRAANKVQIGAYIDLATDAGIRAWLKSHPRLTKTDFLFEAILEKLKQENIVLPPEAGNRQRPMRPQVVINTSPHILNEPASSSKDVEVGLTALVDAASVAVASDTGSPKRLPPARRTTKAVRPPASPKS